MQCLAVVFECFIHLLLELRAGRSQFHTVSHSRRGSFIKDFCSAAGRKEQVWQWAVHVQQITAESGFNYFTWHNASRVLQKDTFANTPEQNVWPLPLWNVFEIASVMLHHLWTDHIDPIYCVNKKCTWFSKLCAATTALLEMGDWR